MNLLCRAKMILEAVHIDARTPFRTLTLVTSIGLLIGFGSFANCATPAPAILQDDDHQKDHDVHRHELHSHSDGNVEVIVLKDDKQEGKEVIDLHSHLLELLHEKESGTVDHQELIEKLKTNHNLHLHKLLSDHNGDHEVVVIQGDVQEGDEDIKIHRHLLELLHEKESGTVDHQELIEKLNANHNLHLHELHSGHDGDHEVVVIKGGVQEGDDNMDLHRHLVELLHGKISGKVNHQELAEKLRQIADRLEAHDKDAHPKHEVRRKIELLRKTGEPQKLIIDLKTENDENAHSHDEDHAKILLRVKEDDAQHNVIVEEIQGDREHTHASKLNFGATSNESLDQAIRELKIELQQLQQELDQLRSEKPAPAGTKVRLRKEGKTGLHSQESDAAIWVIDRSEKEQSSSDNQKSKDFLWVEGTGTDKSANKFFLKKSKDKTGKANPAVFRFNFKTKDRESTENSSSSKRD